MPFVPVRTLMKDQFRSDERIGRVTAPLLVLHGERDRTVPVRFGERLFALAREPKRLVRFPKAGHNDLDAHGATEEAQQFIHEQTGSRSRRRPARAGQRSAVTRRATAAPAMPPANGAR